MDIVLINSGDRKQIFQGLGSDAAAIEPPFWIAVIAAYLREKGFQVSVIDSNAENISPKETAVRVRKLAPLLTAIIVYGSQPSASTQNMTISMKICDELNENNDSLVAMAGLHTSALPKKTMEESSADFVIEGEGPLTLEALLKSLQEKSNEYSEIPGLWYRKGGQIVNNPRADNIDDLDKYLPMGAWDLLPMDKYRAHNWHCFDDIDKRQPYGTIYTSLGCPYSCSFCCINAPFGKPGIRFRSPELVVEEMELLQKKYGVKNLKIVDELFVLRESHYMKIVDLIIEKELDLNIWAYARVDTIKIENMLKMKKAGINWLALGIESANPDVRDGASKKIRVQNIKNVVNKIQAAGIYIIGNFIFGLPDDTLATMQETLDMAVDLNCEFVNFYCAMAYPGSKLYDIAIKEELELPQEWHDFSQHGYGMQPLPTKHLPAKDIVEFRDNAFHSYFENPEYLESISQKFGPSVKEHIREITRTRLKRKILEA
jgi:anaerobic magnesium-protoporphyrin IX monomethyl ester cyclase